MLKLMIAGAGGLVGRAVTEEARDREWEVTPADAGEINVWDAYATRSTLSAERPDVLVHCLGSPSPERAEREPERAVAMNRTAARNVASVCASLGCISVFPSSHMVFDGTSDRPYTADDAPRPSTAFGRAVLSAEREVEGCGGRWLVVRSCWVYGAGGRNVVDDVVERARNGTRVRASGRERASPTWAGTLARAMLDLVVAGTWGIHHVAARGEVTARGLAEEILRMKGMDPGMVSSEENGREAPEADALQRPENGVLDVSATEELLGRELPHWRDPLAAYLKGGEDR